MSTPTTMQRAQEILAERRRLGFQAHKSHHALMSFARYADRMGHPGPLNVEHMSERARHDKCKRGTPETCTETAGVSYSGSSVSSRSPADAIVATAGRQHAVVDLLAVRPHYR